MKIRKMIFGSDPEYNLFKALQDRWSKDFDLWPSLPFSCIVELEKSEPSLSYKERDFFYNTNIDYTLCTKSGSPVLSIEFDGLGKGFSRNGEYIQIKESRDPYRKIKLDLKIRMAKIIDYPFYVISFEESEKLAPDLSLTIVDGIIGQVLAKKIFREKINTLYDENREMIESLPNYAQREYMQNLVCDAGTIAELRSDPIAELGSKYLLEATEKGIISGWKEEFLNDPALPEGDPFEDPAILEKRIDVIKSAVRVGFQIIINTPKVAIIEPVWVRNFEDNFISPSHIAKNIAEMLAFKKVLDLIRKD
jgi:hypothetical protein